MNMNDRSTALRAILLVGLVLSSASPTRAEEVGAADPPKGDAPAIAEPIELVLKPEAEATAWPVPLSDLVILRGGNDAIRAKIAEVVLELPASVGPSTEISHDKISEKLSEAGMNIADFLMGGARVCAVAIPDSIRPVDSQPASQPVVIAPRRESDGQAAVDAKGAETQPASRPWKVARTLPGKTLASVLTHRVQAEYDKDDATVELEFEPSGAEFLDLVTPPLQFAIQAGQRGKAGLREFRVTLEQDGVKQRTIRLAARVKVTQPVVVASSALSAGNYVKFEDLTLEPRTFLEGENDRFVAIEELVGQRVKRLVEKGEALRKADLKPEPLVVRSRPVLVQGAASGVSVRISGVSLDNGMLGDEVRVRVGAANGKRRELRGKVVGIGKVEITEE